MPIYEYACQKCKAHLEIMQKVSDKPLTRCRECGGKLEKQWSQTSFQLKGSGWYVTDYAGKKSDGKKTEAKETGAKKGEAATGTEAASPKSEDSHKPSPSENAPAAPTPKTASTIRNGGGGD